MILFGGKIYDTSRQDELIGRLSGAIDNTFKAGLKPASADIIDACDILVSRIRAGEFDDIITPFMNEFNIDGAYLDRLLDMFTRDGLMSKMKTELPEAFDIAPLNDKNGIPSRIIRKIYPLGVLLHIAAGNFDVLPAYSVVEGLLAGNINILKLPAGDSGLSVKLLSELISIRPGLAEFIYVFDVPSTETESIVKLAELSNGIAVWGGDQAIAAARRLAPVNTKIITWGHKLSFAYAEPDCSGKDLEELARAVCITNQTLCSSCQGIFVDTNSDDVLDEFGKRFFNILTDINKSSTPVPYGMKAKNAINIYNEHLEAHNTSSLIMSAAGVSVIVKRDSELDLSYMYRSVWIRKLPSSDIYTLHKHKDHLQTASVLTSDDTARELISRRLAEAGVVRITGPGTMSDTLPGEAHDGTYALREYSRIVEFRE
ncbi:Acyl-CoA reductase (LuxC) [Ruminococcaceae bacterium YRB3002]|nr:Acyl-CoA reductase (LuxC) [Ruminococcaceae bacterium YRB3002]